MFLREMIMGIRWIDILLTNKAFHFILSLALLTIKVISPFLANMDEELNTEELMDLRVILLYGRQGGHKKIPRLESRAPKVWDKVDRMYKYKQKGNEYLKTAKTDDSDKLRR